VFRKKKKAIMPWRVREEPEKPAVKVYPDGREVCSDTADGKAEYDHRRRVMLERQGGVCCICGRPLKHSDASFEHEHCRGAGGAWRDDRTELPDGRWINGAACWTCNSAKGSALGHYNDAHNELLNLRNLSGNMEDDERQRENLGSRSAHEAQREEPRPQTGSQGMP